MSISPPRLLAHVSFWLATLMMVVVGWTLYDAANSERESSRRVAHTQEVRQAAGEINELLSRSEAAQRGYLLSGRDTFLSERDQAFANLDKAVAQVKQLTSDNPDQQPRIAEIETLVAARVARMRDSARLQRTEDIESAQDRAAGGVGQETSARIHESIAALRREELRLLKLHHADAERRRMSELSALIAWVAFGAIVLIPGYLAFVLQSRARARTEKMLRVMADSLPGAIYQLRHDAQGRTRFTFTSAGMTNLCGVGAAGAGALPEWASMIDSIDERDRPAFVAALAAATTSLAAFRHDYRVRQGDGSMKCLHHEASLQREDGGDIVQNGYVADATEQRRLEDALQEAKASADAANRAKSTFLATMSHEIRTPMNGALGMLELLSLTSLDAEQRTTLGIVRESSKSLLRIIDDILDFSMIEAGKLEVRPEAVSIRQLIEGVHNIYSGNASRKGLSIKCVTDPGISAALLVDPLRLRQILGNFVSNALKFTSRGSIEIRAELVAHTGTQQQVRFCVKDTGAGIATQDQQRLFQPFSQGDDDEARRVGGTGLGLTICRRLAGMMGGSVEMASERGRGTTMFLNLSLQVADAAHLPECDQGRKRDWLSTTTSTRRMAPGVAQAESEGTLALVVDDHPVNRVLLARQVQALGYAAESAENGVEALEKWKSGRFGIVITDCDMAEMDGYELARSIRRLESASGALRTPIVACTANALGGEAEACLAAGMDDCLVKPVELSRILQTLDQWLPIPPPAADPAPAPGERAAAAPVDRSVLAAMSGGNAQTERDILADFRRVNDEDVVVLKEAVARSDAQLVARCTHRIIGVSRMVGALALAGVCERIEHACRADDWTTVAAGMGAFALEWGRVNAYVDAL